MLAQLSCHIRHELNVRKAREAAVVAAAHARQEALFAVAVVDSAAHATAVALVARLRADVVRLLKHQQLGKVLMMKRHELANAELAVICASPDEP